MTSKHWLLSGLCGVLVLIAGRSCCSPDSGGRIAISGTVTYDGDPLADGGIQFVPDTNTTGPSAIGTIKNGEYEIRAEDGVLPGTYLVQVTRGGSPGHPAERHPGSPDFGRTRETIEWPELQIIASGASAVVLDFDLPPIGATE